MDNTQAVTGYRRVEVIPGKFMILMHGNITKCNVDSIVNAAKEDLKHIGGVAAAINSRSVLVYVL